MTKTKQDIKKSTIKNFLIILIIIIFTLVILISLNYMIPHKYYNANDFKIKTIYSKTDFDKDLIDDYTDFVLGARIDVQNNPTYISKYYEAGYPPDNEGVCTDTIWRAFKNAGYSLKDMIDLDIEKNLTDYKDITTPDSNIDFRRVRNLEVYFKKYATSLTLNPDDYKSWQPGDIVIFGSSKHIGIISDKRNRLGIPYVIHNNGHGTKEEDYLTKSRITGHYRFDASNINKELLIEWKN